MCDALSSMMNRFNFSPKSNESNNFVSFQKKNLWREDQLKQILFSLEPYKLFMKKRTGRVIINIVLLHKGDAKLFRPYAQVLTDFIDHLLKNNFNRTKLEGAQRR